MRNRFDEQLSVLHKELITMGALCEDAIACAVKCLTDDNERMKEACIEADRQIDRKERDIEMLCMKLLLQQQPVAKDLRVISAALKMISDMERIGDQAVDIVEIAPFIAGSGLEKKTHISVMAEEAIKMVTDSIDSFVKNDEALAKEAIAHDDIVDALFDEVKKELIKTIAERQEDAETLIDLLLIAKYFERIGDHAENIAEWVIFSVTGNH